MCISSDGNTIWAFGDGDYGKLGLGNSTAKSTPVKIDSLLALGLKKVACGTQFTVALTRDGRVFTWGQGQSVCSFTNKYSLNHTSAVDCAWFNFLLTFCVFPFRSIDWTSRVSSTRSQPPPTGVDSERSLCGGHCSWL